jgi:hypothetical protein
MFILFIPDPRSWLIIILYLWSMIPDPRSLMLYTTIATKQKFWLRRQWRQCYYIKKPWLDIRILIGSGFNQISGSGSGFGFGIRMLQGWGLAFSLCVSGSSISGLIPIRIWIKSRYRPLMITNGDTKLKVKKIQIQLFVGTKTKIYPTIGSIKCLQVRDEAFSPPKSASNILKYQLLQICFYCCGSFLPSWSWIYWAD